MSTTYCPIERQISFTHLLTTKVRLNEKEFQSQQESIIFLKLGSSLQLLQKHPMPPKVSLFKIGKILAIINKQAHI